MSDPVLSLLQSKNLSYTVSGRDYLISCLNPKHEDSNPSLRVDKTNGLAHCFACGFKRNLFKHFGVFTDNTSVKVAKLKEKLQELAHSTVDLDFPKGSLPYNQSVRGITNATLKHFGAFYTHEVEKLENRVCFPIKNVIGKTVVFVCRHTDMNGNPRYLNHPSSTVIPCYPMILEQPAKSVVLVEGIFDMLNLYDKGLTNVVCTFGTQTLKNNTNQKLLPLKAQGVVKVFILYDADEPGIEAAKELKPLIEDAGFIVEILNLSSEESTALDPGDLNQEYVTGIKDYIASDDENRKIKHGD